MSTETQKVEERCDLGLFMVEVQQSIVAVGTFCELDDLTIASVPAKDKLSELLAESLDLQRALREWRNASIAAIESLRHHGLNLHASRLQEALASIGAKP